MDNRFLVYYNRSEVVGIMPERYPEQINIYLNYPGFVSCVKRGENYGNDMA